MQSTSGIGTKRRKPSASLHAYKVCKLKQEPVPYIHNFTEDEASKKMKKSTWSEVPPSTEESPIEFTGTHGPKGKALDAITELDAFNLFIDDEIIGRMVESTNISIAKHMKRSGDQESVCNAPTCGPEIRCFLGLNLFRGLYNEADILTDEVWYGVYFFARLHMQ